MAFENGYLVQDYIGTTIEKYREDSDIFYKALQIIPVFMNQSAWPHNFDDLDTAIFNIIGDSLSGLAFGFTQRYLYSDRMEWPDNLPKGFREDLQTFHSAIDNIVNQFWYSRTNPMKFFSVARSYDQYKNKNIIRFIRNDGNFVDMELDKFELEYLINTLKQFLEEDKEEDE